MRHLLTAITLGTVLGISSLLVAQEARAIPEDVQKTLTYFDGEWVGEWVTDGGETIAEYAHRKPILGGRFTVVTGNAGERQFYIVSGWDAATGKLTDCAFLSDGTQIKETWTLEKNGEWFSLTSDSVGVTGDGLEYSSHNIVRVVGSDEYTYEATNCKVNGISQPGFKAHLKRKSAQANQGASKEQFLRLGDMLVGEWTSEFASDLALEGICEKGDKIMQITSFEWVSDKTALLEKRVYRVGEKVVAEGAALISWDAPRRQIKSSYTDSLGGTWQSVWRNRGEQWVVQDRGLFGDGRESVARSVLSCSPDGDALTFKFTARLFDREALPDMQVTLHRAPK